MKLPPLNSQRDFRLWPPFSPGEWLDFNPTVVTLESGKMLALIRRNRIPPVPGISEIWMIEVDHRMLPVGSPHPLIELGEDPRAVVINDRLFIFYVVIERNDAGAITGSHLMLAEFNASQYPPIQCASYLLPKNPTSNPALKDLTWEKNWVPFVTHENQIAIIYSHAPWTVLTLDVTSRGEAPRLANAFIDKSLTWDYGPIRGGSSPIKYDSEHSITYFHSCQVVGTRNVYMVGACLFRDTPPYSPKLMTPDPLMVAPYRSTIARFGWLALVSVIFPVGLVQTGNVHRLLCGIDDGEIGIFEVSGDELGARLAPIPIQTACTITGAEGYSTTLPPDPWIISTASPLNTSHVPLARFLRMLPQMEGTFVDIGAGAGLFSVYLAANHSKVVAFEHDNLHDLSRNIALNEIAHVHVIPEEQPNQDSPIWAMTDISLIRINTPYVLPLLELARPLLETSMPIIFIQDFHSSLVEADCGNVLASLGYAITHPFSSAPECAIATTPTHRNSYPWIF